jgi:GNAT superfamily N-acetyltransferase
MAPLTNIEVRRARPPDLALLEAFLARCSPATLYRRFHGAAGRPVSRELRRIARPTAIHRSWVALGADGEVHGTATLAWGPTGPPHAAFLVEDAWFRRGIGRALARELTAEARQTRVPAVMATIQADNDRAVRFARAMSGGVRPRYAGTAELELTVPLAPGVTEHARLHGPSVRGPLGEVAA